MASGADNAWRWVCCLALGTACAPPPADSEEASPPPATAEQPASCEPRAPRPAPSLTLVFGGDVSFGRQTGKRLLSEADFNPLSALAPFFRAADLSFVNLESPLSDQGGETRHPERPLAFVGPPAGAGALAGAAIDVVSVANNHIWDYGRGAFEETLGHLQQAGVAYAGASRTRRGALQPCVLRQAGWSLAFFAVTDVWNAGPLHRHEGADFVADAKAEGWPARVRRARREHDLVIVSYHGGKEYSEHVAREPRDFARTVMAAGADAFVAHHPHVPQGVEWFEGRPALYSLGDLVFERHKDHLWTERGFLARIQFSRSQKPRVELCPYAIVGGVPRPATQAFHRSFRLHLRRLLANADFTDVLSTAEPGCVSLSPQRSPISSPAVTSRLPVERSRNLQ